jgi:hypothetical protein
MSTISAGTNVNTSLNYSADTTGNLVLQSSGSSITLSNTANTIIMGGSVITSGTAVASTSGTSIDFTGIPSWVKRITVIFNGVSTNGASTVLVRLGTSSGIVTTGYTGGGASITSSVYPITYNTTVGIAPFSVGAGSLIVGSCVITNISSNTWISSHNVQFSEGIYVGFGAGSIALSGVLDRIRITTTNGTDTFDAGSINILYE